jgi:beta-glucosidase
LTLRRPGEDASLRVAFSVTNSGPVAGAEIPQFYLGFPAAAGEPPKQLKGFTKTAVLQPGEVADVAFELTPRDVSVWDVEAHRFEVARGEFTAYVGASSCDVRLSGKATV